MKFYFYIITRDCETFHSGYTKDPVKCAKAYKAIPGMIWPPKPNSLVYLEELKTEENALITLNSFLMMNKSAKIALIEETNPQWFELIPGQNITL